jgi:hypothetical protein
VPTVCSRSPIGIATPHADAIARRLPFRGIVFGHVILAVTRKELQGIRAHERVHVDQYERWGPLFFFAYGASSLWQLLHGRRRTGTTPSRCRRGGSAVRPRTGRSARNAPREPIAVGVFSF